MEQPGPAWSQLTEDERGQVSALFEVIRRAKLYLAMQREEAAGEPGSVTALIGT